MFEEVAVTTVIGIYFTVCRRIEEVATMFNKSEVVNLLYLVCPIFSLVENGIGPGEEVFLLLAKRAKLETSLELMRHPRPNFVVMLHVAVLKVISSLIDKSRTERCHVGEDR